MPETMPNVRSIFDRAQEIDSERERRSYLDEVCGGRPEVRGQVETLLAAHAAAGSFLETPPTFVTNLADTARELDGQTPDISFLLPSERADALGRLGHYEVLAVVGSGGFGVVLKAFDSQLHRIVAIKALHSSLAASATARQRFVREARAAAAINHENVVDIYAVEEAGPVPYLAMEYVGGVSLEERLKADGPPSVKEILRSPGRTMASHHLFLCPALRGELPIPAEGPAYLRSGALTDS